MAKKSFQTTKDSKPWDFIIIGGGPVGLTAAQVASNKGYKVILLEKANKCGAEIRGETIEPDESLLQNIWGKNFLDNITITSCSNNIFYSPLAKHIDTMILQRTPHIFHWEKFINEMVNTVTKKENPVTLVYKSEVTDIIMDKDVTMPVRGVKTSNDKILGNTIIDCSGHSSSIGKKFNFPYSTINNPILKSRYSNYPKKKGDFITFFITSDCIKTVKDPPPGMALIFPNKEGTAEVIYIVFSEYGPHGKRSKDEEEITEKYLWSLWDDVKNNLPVFSDIMKGLKKEYEYFTGIPAQNMLPYAIYRPGLLFMGDSVGFLMDDTASGIMTGMEEANWWITTIANNRIQNWTIELMKQLNNQFKETIFYQNVKSIYEKTGRRKDLAYNFLITADNFTVFWGLIKNTYNWLEEKKALKITDDEFKMMDWDKKAAVINALANPDIVGPISEKKISSFIAIASQVISDKEWEAFLSELNINIILKKVDSSKYLGIILNALGPSYKVQFAIVRNSIYAVMKLVDKNAIKASSITQKSELLSIFLTKPLIFGDQQDKVIEILKTIKKYNGKEEMEEVVNKAGGKELLYHAVSDKKKQKELDKLFS